MQTSNRVLQEHSSLSSSDLEWLDKVAALKDLRNHPAWKVYQDEVLDITIGDIRDMLLNGIPGLNSAGEEVGCMRALRIMLKTLVKVRERPHELINTAQSVRQEFNIPDAEGDVDAGRS